MDNKRLASIDTLRFLAIWGVLVIHGHDYFGWSYKDTTGWVKIAAWLLNKACSFAVPLFFIISGYLFGKSFLKEKNITKVYLKHIQRLLIVFIGWSFIYSIVHFQPFSAHQWQIIKQYGLLRAYYWDFQDAYLKNPVLLLLVGTAGHLWFISALIQSLTLILFFILLNQEKFLIYSALLIFIFTPVARLYIQPPPGEYDYNWNPLIGVFQSTPPVVMGWWLSKKKEYQRSTSFVVLTVSILLVCGEFAKDFYGFKLSYEGAGSLLMPLGLLMLALLNPEWSKNTIFPDLGRMTLGIYCVHTLVMYYLMMFTGLKNQYLWAVPLLFLTYLISLFIILILKISPLSRKLAV